MRDLAADTAAVAVAAVLGALLIIAMQADGMAPYPPWELTAGAIALIALAVLRRRRPVGLAAFLIVLGTFSAATLGATVLALYSVAAHRPRRPALVLAGLHLLIMLSLWHVDSTPREYVEGVVTFALLDAVAVAAGMLTRSRRMLIRSLEARARQAEEEQRLRAAQARRLERERIAREMHDVLAHRISLLAMHAGALEYRPDAPAGDIERTMGVIRQNAAAALEDLREVVGVLRGHDDDAAAGGETDRPQPTLAELPALIEAARDAGTPITLHDRLTDPAAMPAGLGRHAYRIVQEGLTNARKHAPGSPVLVTLTGEPGGDLTVELRNPLRVPAGAGTVRPAPPPLPGAGLGLVGLRERVDLTGGRIEHGRAADGDFRLWVSLPWRT